MQSEDEKYLSSEEIDLNELTEDLGKKTSKIVKQPHEIQVKEWFKLP